MSEVASGLREQVGLELGRPAPVAATALSDAIRARHGDAVAAVIFYGSCLRKSTSEGVLDFYVVVDDYRSAYGWGWLAAANAVLAPNVFYLEAEAAGDAQPAETEAAETEAAAGAEPTPPTRTVRCKYAVLSAQHFESLVEPDSIHPYIWARFAQPALLVWARDDAARQLVEECAEQSVITLVQRLAPFLPATKDVQKFSLAAMWQEAFRRTYRTELRGESTETIRSHYEADPARYDACGRWALETLCNEGWIDAFSSYGGAVEVYQPSWRRSWARTRWQLCWPLAKALVVLRLLKTAFTFGDWLPYVLWKIERHSGKRFEISERQRRHPLIFGWPVIFRVLAGRTLR